MKAKKYCTSRKQFPLNYIQNIDSSIKIIFEHLKVAFCEYKTLKNIYENNFNKIKL